MSRIRFVVVAATALACGRVSDTLSLERDLVRDFHTDAISVNVEHDTGLTVLFTSSDAAMLAGADRAGYARQVAEYVRDHYPGYATLRRIDVGFTATAPVASYSFTATDLGSPARGASDASQH